MRRLICLIIVIGTAVAHVHAGELRFNDRFAKLLIEGVPQITANYDPQTGHFGKGIWICTDQNSMYPLAVAYSLDVPGNKYHKNPQILEMLMKAGDALIEDADANGQWVFRKKDGSTWGKIYMPWTYSRWIRTFALIRKDMPAARRVHWEEALSRGFANINKSQLTSLVNIPTHLAMGLYIAGQTLDRPEWCAHATEFLHKVLAAQSENGYWSEGHGPVVNYNFVYVDAFGIYYALSHDQAALQAVQRASKFHRSFTYPDGNSVETVDQRNPFHNDVAPGGPGFTFDKIGRTYLASQWARYKDSDFNVDFLACMLQYGQEGSTEDETASANRVFVMKENGVDQAMTIRKGPWFICLSAITTPVGRNRWYQDRQSFVSIYHDRVGLIIGGGNTKLQPAWSNFTVGDMSLLKHKPGDRKPDFLPKGELYHVPSKAVLVHEPVPGLDLTYGHETCHIRVNIKGDRTLEYDLSATTDSGLPVLGHITLLPRMNQTVTTAAGSSFKLNGEQVALPAKQVGGSIHYAGCDLTVPPTASLHWPMLPHNPYRIDGHAEPAEGRLEIRLPFNKNIHDQRIVLAVD